MALALPRTVEFASRRGMMPPPFRRVIGHPSTKDQTMTKTATPKQRPAAPAVKETRLFINNQWVDPAEGKTFDTYNPATGQVIAKVAHAGAADVDKAVKAARKALESGPWGKMDAADRGRLMFK